VNRPSYAFGALLMLLALAMLAVSSASRSTTVASTAPAAPSAAGSAPTRTTPRGAIYVLVLPAADDEAPAGRAAAPRQGADAADDDASPEPSPAPVALTSSRAAAVPTYATGCGLDRLTGLVYGCEPCWISYDDERPLPRPRIAPARIELAKNNAARRGAESAVDCLSHYDPLYDRLIYGPISPSPARQEARLPAVRWTEVEGAELLGLFQQLAPRNDGASAAAPAQSRRRASGALRGAWNQRLDESLPLSAWEIQYRQVQNLRTMYLGLRNYVVRQMHAAGLHWDSGFVSSRQGLPPAAPIAWSQYAELLDSRPYNPTSASHPARKTAVGPESHEAAVRSSRWMLHSAASMLNQAGLWLQDAAVTLERAGADLEARQPAGVAR
jgi:hypothetical protein